MAYSYTAVFFHGYILRRSCGCFSKIVLTYYEVPEFSLQVLSALFGAVVIGIPAFAVMVVAVWLERVIFLKRYCAKLQKSGTDPCPGEKTE